MEGEKNKSKKDWVARTAGGTQEPGLLGARRAAAGSVRAEKESASEGSHESRWAWKGGGVEQGQTKATQMGQGTVGGERVGVQTPSRGGGQKGLGEGPWLQ